MWQVRRWMESSLQGSSCVEGVSMLVMRRWMIAFGSRFFASAPVSSCSMTPVL